jgi:D-glycero-D-manno-heptose 1,7-bisphosphate phosphatase
MATARPTPILFLDLDGTVIHGKEELGHFVTGPHEVEVFEGVLDKLKVYKSQGWRLVLISNQGGIAMGHIAENTVNRIMQEANRLTANLFDRIVYCPHHPEANKDEQTPETLEMAQCFCRKPRGGLVYATMASLTEQFHDEYYRPYAALFVGDLDTDRQCAESCGIEFKSAKDWREM